MKIEMDDDEKIMAVVLSIFGMIALVGIIAIIHNSANTHFALERGYTQTRTGDETLWTKPETHHGTNG